MKILNICAHTGGGVGTTLKNFLENDKKNDHTLACLNDVHPLSETVEVKTYNNLKDNYSLLNELVLQNDIVILHWYNYPIIYDLLIKNGLPPCRLIIWGLANNLHSPYDTPEKLIDMADRFIVSSKVSFTSPQYFNLDPVKKDKFGFIWCSANMCKFKNTQKIEHSTFNIGYAGTIDFNSKLHPNFVDVCHDISKKIDNVKFIICSSGPSLDELKEQVKYKKLESKFEFLGRVDDLSVPFSKMDVFMYLLYEKHYGTSEQVLGEAMCTGLVPIVLNNLVEQEIVQDNSNGFVCKINDIADSVYFLYKDKEVYNRLSQKAKETASSLYDTQTMLDKWNEEFNKLIFVPKKEKKWRVDGSYIFKESLCEVADIFEHNNYEGIKALYLKNKQWLSTSKASIFQYASIYPEDKKLQSWKQIAEDLMITLN